MATSVPPNECLPKGLDAKSIYLLNINLLGNPRKVRKDFRCFCFDKVIDPNTMNFKDFIESIVQQYPPSYMEVPHIQYHDSALNTFPQVQTDHDFQLMFEKHTNTKVVQMFIGYTDPTEPYEPITDWQIDDCPSPSQTKKTQPMQQQPINSIQTDEDSYLQNPLPENEHVGIDDEVMYLTAEPLGVVNVVVCVDEKRDKYSVAQQERDEEGSHSEGDPEEDFIAKEEDVVEPDHMPNIEYDPDDPPMLVGTTYPDMEEFKLALCAHAIRHEFEFNTEKSTPYRFRAYCARKEKDRCPWRIHASTMEDMCTVMVKKNPFGHDCSSTRRNKKVKNATKQWICSKVKDWLIQDATLGAKTLQMKLKEHYKINIHYKRVYMGKELALKQLYGDWDSSFDNLFRFKAEIENSCPGSLVVIDHHTINGKIRFRRMFFALKPCIEGFLSGCRPYLAIDSTFLTGKYKGQLAGASAVDGHNWLYPVCVGIFDSETNENWTWFMQRLREAIGSPRGLAICTDAGQPVMTGVKEVFPEAEHRECMFHLVANFKKKFHGKVFDDHLWPAAYSWNQYLFEKHWVAMERAKPAATAYLRKWHTRLWTRSQFSTRSKVDYVTNNLAECFNNWIKLHKSLNLDDFMDKIRQMLMIKWNQRRKVSRKVEGLILPHIIKKLNETSRDLNFDVVQCSEEVGEVTILGGSGFRFVVNLHERACSCRQWQVSGIPCKHAVAFITSLSNEPLESHVDLYYSIKKFRTAYDQLIPAIPDKSHWPESSHGFFMHPPLLKATAGRRRIERYKGCTEKKNKKGQHKCPICTDYGHHWPNCKKGNPEDIAALMAVRGPPKKRKRTTKAAPQSSIVHFEDEAPAPCMYFPPRLEPATKKKDKCSASSSSKSTRSATGSNHLDHISIEFPMSSEQRIAPQPAAKKAKGKKQVGMKGKPKRKEIAKDNAKKLVISFDSPAMGTRSKNNNDPASPGMSTRSKRRLSL